MKFGEHIKIGRLAKQLKKSELARRVAITPQYLADIEQKGAVPSEEVIEKLVSVLDLNEIDTFRIADKLPIRIIEKAKQEYFGG
jgi:transcriptional regulator with XRE-family HTH domain